MRELEEAATKGGDGGVGSESHDDGGDGSMTIAINLPVRVLCWIISQWNKQLVIKPDAR